MNFQQIIAKASALHRAGDNAAAWQLLSPVTGQVGKDVQLQMLVGMVAREVGDLHSANRAFAIAFRLAGNDPQIGNIYANSLSAIGRQAEALVLFETITSQSPRFFDGHINFALTAEECGKPELAMEVIARGLQQFPDNPRLIAVRAMAEKNLGSIVAALASFQHAIQIQPDRARTRHNYASTLMAAGQYEEAVSEFSAAIKLGQNDIRSYANLAAALVENGHLDAGVDIYRNILMASPDDIEAAQALTRIAIEYDRGEDPFAHYAAAAGQGRGASPWRNWLAALIGHQRFDEAADIASRAAKEFQDDLEFDALGHFCRAMHGDAAPEIGPLIEVVKAGGDSNQFRSLLAQVALKGGAPELAAEQAEAMSRTDPADQTGWAYLATAWRMLDDPREYWLCDYDRLIVSVDVPSIGGVASADQFAKEIADCLDRWHNTIRAPGNQSLRHGTQTSGALFDRVDPVLIRFRDSALDTITHVITNLPDDPSHPFLCRKSNQVRFAGSWSVRLASSGHHVPHFHSQGWISSAYYARLPKVMDQDSTKIEHQGHIAFGAPPEILGLDLPPRRVVQPKQGMLVLFPSYMWHGTLPFQGEDTRLTAAFDIIPKA